MDDEDDWPKKRHSAADMPADDGRLARATALVYALAAIALVAALVFAFLM
jgi:hypothetical protein